MYYKEAQALQQLQRSKNYQVIVSKSWLQPGLPKETAVPVLIQGGKEFDGNYELDGTVEISLSRYLHIRSNLWLSKYVKQIALPGNWWEQPTFENDFSPSFTLDPVTTNPGVSDTNLDVSEISPESHISPQRDPANNPLGTAKIQFIQDNFNQDSTHYEAIRTVVLNESRKMRSREIHYLDHPLFGLLVKVSPYLKPEPKAEQTPKVQKLKTAVGH